MKDRRFLDAVDAALDASRRDAADAALPGALRARILAAARPLDAPPPRGRVVDFVLRAAAVAAAIAAVVTLMPVSLEAAEFDAAPLVEFNARVTTSVAEQFPRLSIGGDGLPDATLALAAGAVVLVGAGLALVRRGGRA